MSYKTILAHFNDKRRVGRIANVVADLASRFGAHLIGLSVSPPIRYIPAGMPGTPDVIADDAQRMAYRKDNPQLRHGFLEACGARGLAGEWRERDADDASLSATVLTAARRSDLIVLAQKDHAWSHTSQLDVDNAVILGAGRPVLLVPNDGLASASARRVLVAWNERREASRAVFDALPLLREAEDVKIVTFDEELKPDTEDSDLDICSTLLRHDVKCRTTERIVSHTEIGQAITQQTIAHKADLLVMGCYGHSRLREFVLGGASRHQLHHMMIPVLMSH